MTTYSTYAYADINGESIKSNLINNILLPISFVVVGFLLIKELAKKSVAGILVVLIVGGIRNYNDSSTRLNEVLW
ncbi:hypothetical protein MCG45_17140 [Clostridium perfringens]|uniref:TcpD family membrane protein n=1 Tax=Clostridium perfringens TaxID=1502 RepID=UPI001F06664B|nr:TcpD family membrane protein [Clostridium perfringens]MCH1964553.1 hypothetical protein [Clostridium perfringens]